MSKLVPPTSPSRTLTLPELFFAFAQMSLSGFGGVLPWAHRIIVEDRAWLTPDEFNQMLALSQVLPGPNIVNFSIVFGSRARGVRGSGTALTGLLGVPLAIALLLGIFYIRFAELSLLRRPLSGIAAAASGLVIANAIKLARPLLDGRSRSAPFIALAAFLSVGVAGLSVPMVVLILAPISVALATSRLSR